MSSNFTQQMEICIQDFYRLYNLDQYLSKKVLDAFLLKYKEVLTSLSTLFNDENPLYRKIRLISTNGQDMVDIKNKKYIQKHLKEDKEYFDHLFDEVDKNILLDEEQRKAILIDEDYSLIIAGAGAGKTTTMAAKVKYLIEKKKVSPKKIIILSYTNKAVEELNELLNEKFHLHVEVYTFHALGMKFLRELKGSTFTVASHSDMISIFSDYFSEVVFQDKHLLRMFQENFEEFIHLEEYAKEYAHYDDYFNHYIEVKTKTCEDLTKEIKRLTKERMKRLQTINGEFVKSEGEVKIANYLYTHGIPYTYEGAYPHMVGYMRTYQPDFTIHNADEEIYVEYYGMAIKNNDGSIFSSDQTYKETILKKKMTHQKFGTDLIELYGRYQEDDYFLPRLSKELTSRLVPRNELSEESIYKRLLETNKMAPYYGLLLFLQNFIERFKGNNYQFEDFEELKYKTDDVTVQRQLTLLRHTYLYYEKKLKERNQIDFSDMIYYAYEHMHKIKEKSTESPYQYIVIDEYQDISNQRHQFARRISDLFQAKIVAVGDDWQTIFSFSGSNIQLFTRFYELMGYGEIIKITNTYRNSQELIDIAGEFITKNTEQIEKHLKSNKHIEYPVELVGYHYSKESDDLAQTVSDLIVKLYEENPQHKILLLVRFNDEEEHLLKSDLFFKRGRSTSAIYCKAAPKAKIDLLTVHKAKGLGYDQVILLNGLNLTKGFPALIRDHEVIKLLKRVTEEEEIELAEERRLFYVALTRTKNKLYILSPNDSKYRSDFIKEIESNEHVVDTNNED